MKGEWIKRNEAGAPVVVFVHGVLSSGETCWRHASGAFWPDVVANDPELAGHGVYVFNYRTGFFSGTYRLGDAVDALKEFLQLDDVLASGQVVFVCHSMGGILVRKFLVERATELIDIDVRVGLFLIASPSLGSEYANWLAPIARFFGHTQADALRFAQSNAWLMDLDREFVNLKEARRLRLQGKELVEDQFIWFRSFWRKQVVTPPSGARYFGEPFKVPASDHFSIAKIESASAVQHRMLRRFIVDRLRPEEDGGQPIVGNSSDNGTPRSPHNSPMKTSGDHKTLAPTRRLAEDDGSKGKLTSYRNSVVAKATGNDWWERPIPILTDENERPGRSARDALYEWITGTEERHCIVLGEPGAGKTGLLTWTASKIIQREKSLALWVSAKRLRSLPEVSLSGVLSLCDPAPPVDVSSDTNEWDVFCLIDGLDELTGAAKDGEEIAAGLLRRTLASLPVEWRVLASCRTPAFEGLRGTINQSLRSQKSTSIGGDHYDDAIRRAIGIKDDSVALIKLARVQTNDAISYLESVDLEKSVIEELIGDNQWRPLLSSPFLLRLARLAVPTLMRSGIPTLDLFYEAYTKAALWREKNDLSEAQICRILEELTLFSNFIDDRRGFKDTELPIRADLIRKKNNRCDFSHYSLWEYFFARHLHTEIVGFSSKTLAHVDLIAAYNVNRMLVPMLLRKLVETDNPEKFTQIVTPREYLYFVDSTGWRGATGYGLHPARSRENARVPPSTFKFEYNDALAVHGDNSHGHGVSPVACGISWYDAATFALWRGVRLPTTQELINAEPSGSHLLWCSDWFNEDLAHIAVYDMSTGKVHGLNPDVRLASTALSIVGSA